VSSITLDSKLTTWRTYKELTVVLKEKIKNVDWKYSELSFQFEKRNLE
jgi:hypothetical protein